MFHHHKRDVSPEEIGPELHRFFEHVKSHDPSGVQAAICMVANATDLPKEDIGGIPAVPMHVCSFGAGDPDVLAQILVMAIDTAIAEVPNFEAAWQNALRTRRLKSVVEGILGVVKSVKEKADEEKGMAEAKPQVDALIEKLKGKHD